MSETTIPTPSDATLIVDKAVLKQKAAAAKVAVRDLADEAGRYATDAYRYAKHRTVEAVRGTNDQAIDYVQRHPYKTLAAAAGIGFIFGVLLKRR